ncbi:pentatricopeptide repeat-containing protein At1g63400-like [Aristolochia californica]|uniref:pentatricopeptide repeat-containing protein At1g63400-like n=1 Tax=Aristolochia californica TaxID=171875 RepID=UPI0035E0153B
MSTALSSFDIINALRFSQSHSGLPLDLLQWIDSLKNCDFDNSLEIQSTAGIVLSNSRNFKHSRQILKRLLERGMYRVDEVFMELVEFYQGRNIWRTPAVFDIFINTCLELEMVEEAMEVFFIMGNHEFNPTTQTCKNLLDALVKSEFVKVVPKVFNEMAKRNICLNIYDYNIWIKGYCKTGLVDKATEVLRIMSHEGLRPTTTMYNVIINFYCKRDVREAERIVEQMRMANVNLDSVTVSTMMNGYIKINNFSKVFEFFNLMVEKKIEPTVPIYRALIDTFCKRGDVEMGVNMLHEMINEGIMPNAIVYNTLIDGFCKLGHLDREMKILEKMLHMGCKPDLVTYSSLIKSFCDRGRIKEAMKFLTHVVTGGLVLDTIIYNSLIDGYCRVGKLNQALKLAYKMISTEEGADVITFNILISSASHIGGSLETNMLLSRMIRHGLNPDFITYSTLIETYFRERNGKDCFKIMSTMEDQRLVAHIQYFKLLIHGLCDESDVHSIRRFLQSVKDARCEVDASLYNPLLDVLCRKGKLVEAFQLCDEMVRNSIPPDVNTCNSLMSGFFNEGSVSKGLKIFRQMSLYSIQPTPRTFMIFSQVMNNHDSRRKVLDLVRELVEEVLDDNDAQMKKCCHALLLQGLLYDERVDEAEKFLEKITKDGAFPCHGSTSQILVSYCEANNVKKAVTFYDKIVKAGLKTNFDSCLALLDLVLRSGYHRIAEQILNHELVRGSRVNYVGYDILIRGLCHCGKLEDALRLTLVGLKNGFIPNSISYNFLLNGLCKVQKLEEAKDLMNWLLDRYVVPDTNTYNVLIKCFCEEGDFTGATEQYKLMAVSGCTPNVQTYNMLIIAYCKIGDLRRSVDLVCEAFALKIFPDTVTCSALLCGLCGRGDMEYSSKLWSMMVDQGVSGDKLTFDSMIFGYCQVGNLKEALRLLLQMLQRGFSCDRFIAIVLNRALQQKDYFQEANMFLGFIVKTNILQDDDGIASISRERHGMYNNQYIREMEGSVQSQKQNLCAVLQNPSLKKQLEQDHSTCKVAASKILSDDENEKTIKLRQDLLELGIL